MVRTLADMTPDERQSCVGMWCEFELGALSILQQVGVDRAYCIIPNGFNVEQSMRLERLTPRFDLPRAWNPDGTPVPAAERLEYGVTAVIGGRRLIMSNTCHGNSMDGMGRWFPMKGLAEDFMRTVTAPEPRLVCRRTSTYWETTDE